jgi:hypothetical protein
MAIIVHFGMHKTGSSSIQEALHNGFQDPAFMYVSMGGANQSGKLATLCMERPEEFHLHRKLGRSRAEVQQLRAEYLRRLDKQAAALGDRTALLSAEKISQMAPSELVMLRNYLSERFGEVRLVGYIRPPKSFMESAFQQRVKDARWMQGGSGLFAASWPGYRERFGAFDDVFGADNVQYWLFDPSRFPNGDVLCDFTARLGIRYAGEAVVRSNESISLPAIRLLYTMRRLGPRLEAGSHLVRCNARLVTAVAQLKGPPLRISAKVAEAIRDRNADDLQWMERRMGCLLREDFGRNGESTVASEADLLQAGPVEIKWLREQLGPAAASLSSNRVEPAQVARLMYNLYEQICADEAAADNGVAGER